MPATSFDDDMGRGQVSRALVEAGGFPPVDMGAFELAYPPATGTAKVVASDDRRRVVVHYVARDSYPPKDFWDPKLKHGALVRGAVARESARRCAAAGFASYWIDEGEGASISGHETHVLYVPPRDVQEAVRLGGDPLAASEGHLRSYGAWRDGTLCGVVSETFRVAPDGTLVHVDTAAEWGALDPESAAKACADRAGQSAPEIAIADSFVP